MVGEGLWIVENCAERFDGGGVREEFVGECDGAG